MKASKQYGRLESRRKMDFDERFDDVHSQHGNLNLRLRRALSWLGRAELELSESQQHDAAFIFYWIAFNALYAADSPDAREDVEHTNIKRFCSNALELDTNFKITRAIWGQFNDSILPLITNKYVYRQFWKHHNGLEGFDNWHRWLQNDVRSTNNDLANGGVAVVIEILFERLYVLRNQLIHGAATYESSVNRKQVEDGAEILALLVPLFIELMMDNPNEDWGEPYYPPVYQSAR